MKIESRNENLMSSIDRTLSGAGSMGTPGMFAACLAQETGRFGEDSRREDLCRDVAALKRKGFTGFFKEIQEERMKELRAQILGEMGLTEDDLGKMDPGQRAQLEKQISEEIRKRMSAESALEDDEKDTGSMKKRLLLSGMETGPDAFRLQELATVLF